MQCHSINTDPVSAERFSKDVLFFTGPIKKKSLPYPLEPAKIYFWDGSNRIRGVAACVENACANNRQQRPFSALRKERKKDLWMS